MPDFTGIRGNFWLRSPWLELCCEVGSYKGRHLQLEIGRASARKLLPAILNDLLVSCQASGQRVQSLPCSCKRRLSIWSSQSWQWRLDPSSGASAAAYMFVMFVVCLHSCRFVVCAVFFIFFDFRQRLMSILHTSAWCVALNMASLDPA